MTIRSNKHKKGNKLVGKSIDWLANPNNKNLPTFYFNNENIEQRIVNIKPTQDLIYSNIYQMRCVEENIQNGFGKGYTEDTDELILDRFPANELVEVAREYEYYGEAWVIHTILNGEILYTYSVPTMNMLIGKNKYKGYAIQNYDRNKNTQDLIEIFDVEEWNAGRIRSGVYAQQIKWGRKTYGIPVWIPAMETIKIMNYSDIEIASYYENSCVPYTVLFTYGVGATTESGESTVNFFERQFQGMDKKHKMAIIQSPFGKDQSAMEIQELQKKIVDSELLNLRNTSKFDICAANGVPYWRVNLTKSGSIGGGSTQERAVEWEIYIKDHIGAKRKAIIDNITLWHPNTQVDFETSEYPSIEQTDEIMIEDAKKASQISMFYDIANEVMNNKYEIDENRPNK